MTKSAIDPIKLERLAEVAVEVGVNLQDGQNLIVTSPMSALPFARLVAAAAYKKGARDVTFLFTDDEITLARYRHGTEAALDGAPEWLYKGFAEGLENNAARMAISAANPTLLSEQDPDKVSRVNRANLAAAKPAMKYISNFDINWSIAAYPSAAWAKQVFPGVAEEEAIEKLADAIFAASRIDNNDPVAAWAKHNAELQSRSDWLNEMRFDALHFTGPGTDLTVGLADDHLWTGGSAPSKNGVVCNPNIPTEEVFTTPHAQRVNGVVRSTKPLAHLGTIIDGIEVRFEDGKIVEAKATKGEAVFQKMISSDEGASRLGEVALVPHSSPISQTGILFYNTLFDENAACHIALGQCYAECIVDGHHLSKEQIVEKGGNQSIIHVDWMIGSAEIDIDGIKADGTRVPVFRKGEWAH
jgi:aminopeptidase